MMRQTEALGTLSRCAIIIQENSRYRMKEGGTNFTAETLLLERVNELRKVFARMTDDEIQKILSRAEPHAPKYKQATLL